MTTAELLLQDYDIEMASARRVLERIPEELPDFKCHDKSMPLGKLAMHVATLPTFGQKILTTPSMDMADPNHKWPDQTFSNRDHAPSPPSTPPPKIAEPHSSPPLTAPSPNPGSSPLAITSSPMNRAHSPIGTCSSTTSSITARSSASISASTTSPVPGLYGPSADEPFGAVRSFHEPAIVRSSLSSGETMRSAPPFALLCFTLPSAFAAAQTVPDNRIHCAIQAPSAHSDADQTFRSRRLR